MEEKINIAEILKNKPKGAKLYNLLYNIDVELETIVTTGTKTIVWCTDKIDNNEVCHRFYSEFGTIEGYPDGLQILLPSKEMRDWSKFAWKKGDVLVNSLGFKLFFDRWANYDYTRFFGKVNLLEDSFSYETEKYTLASKEETLDTLEIEKPEFKDGDIVVYGLSVAICRKIYKHTLYFYVSIDETFGLLFDDNRVSAEGYRFATDEDKQQLFDALAKKWAWDAEKKEVVDKSLVDNKTVFPLELNTMPGFAGSSAYYLRYMDPHNDEALVGKKADEYWQNVDLYVGGCEHATGHLIYSRFWNKFLFDLGVSCKEEPFQKLVNQGMIQGRSNFVYRINSDDHDKAPVFVSLNLKKDYDVTPIHVDVNIVSNDVLDIEAFKAWRPEYQNAEFILEDGKYICGWAIEKMSKSMFNVVNPDMIVEKYGADTLRLYEMFLGPVEASKPWDTNGIDGCHRFLKKFWGLFYENRTDNFLPCDEAAKPESLKSVHKLIKKVSEDIEKFSYNTSISAFMIAVNELGQQKCRNKELLKDLVILIAPFAPHIAEELWAALGEQGSVCDAAWPKYDEQYLKENDMQLTISFNGKARFQMTFPVDTPNEEIQKQVLADEKSQKYLEGFNVLKVIIVPKKIVNVVLKK